MGLAAIALYPPQMYLIPKLQKKVNDLSRQRVQSVRELAGRVGETVDATAEIRLNAAGYRERADISYRLGKIFYIRNEIYRRKFFIKFLNNFLGQLTPFFFYSIGGYLVLKGSLSLGALVAVLAAYKDIAPPWKELLKFYQITEDIRVKYAQIIQQFQPPDMVDQSLHEMLPDEVPKFTDVITASKLSLKAEHHNSKLEDLNFEIRVDQRIGLLIADMDVGREILFTITRVGISFVR